MDSTARRRVVGDDAKSFSIKWETKRARNGPVNLLHGMCAAVVGHRVYAFGGMEHYRSPPELGVYVIDSNHNFQWTKLHPEGNLPGSRRNHSCWLYRDKLYIYGGDLQKDLDSLRRFVGL